MLLVIEKPFQCKKILKLALKLMKGIKGRVPKGMPNHRTFELYS
jgi:hypothetical protein